jgi:Rrf2 family iron-sulfur cluster assembly transcriptional regulator
MKIPTKGRYAVSAMMDLAIHDKIKPLTIAEIAEKQNISLSYLEQLFAVLRKEGLVKGTRGPGGGYRLAQPATSITIAQIIRTVDEKAIDNCREDEQYLPYVLWAELSKKIFAYLDDISLEECVNRPDLQESIEKTVANEKSSGDRVEAAA